MSELQLYRGVWPQNVRKMAKYSVRLDGGKWHVTVLVEGEDGVTFLLVDSSDPSVPERVNHVKTTVGDGPGGAFYVNEYRHIIVPVRSREYEGVTEYYYAGRLTGEFSFEFEGRRYTSRPLDINGTPLAPGEKWTGPLPGIPYVLAAGGKDIYYKTPALTEGDPPRLRPGATRKVMLSKVLRDRNAVRRAVEPIRRVKDFQGGRFYVNEHGAIFTPVGADDGYGLEYIYCGQLDMRCWFPEPPVPDSV